MTIISQTLGTRPVNQDTVQEILNREVIPVLRKAREAINTRLVMLAETVGDGVTVTFSVAHSLGTKDIAVTAYQISTGTDLALTAVTRTDDDTVSVTFAAPPPASDARVLVRV